MISKHQHNPALTLPPQEEKWQVPLLRFDCLPGKINYHLSFVLEVDLFSNKANTQRPQLLILQHCKSTFYSCVASNLQSLNYHSDRLPVKSCQTQTFFTDDKSYFAGALSDTAIWRDGRLFLQLSCLNSPDKGWPLCWQTGTSIHTGGKGFINWPVRAARSSKVSLAVLTKSRVCKDGWVTQRGWTTDNALGNMAQPALVQPDPEQGHVVLLQHTSAKSCWCQVTFWLKAMLRRTSSGLREPALLSCLVGVEPLNLS